MAVGYFPTVAHEKTHQRRVAKGALSRKIHGELKSLVENALLRSWSPEQVSGRLRLEHGVKLSFETIYQHIMRDERDNGVLRAAMRKRRIRHPRRLTSTTSDLARARRRHIDDRPRAANARTEVGHWERDCVIGEHGKNALLVIADRKTRFVKLGRVANMTTSVVARATVNLLRGLPAKSLTNDNGFEFRRDTELEAQLGAEIYVCDPSSPWQRGTVENTNGLIRQYIPKKTDINNVEDRMIVAIEETLNHRPRKILGYRTPHEVFFDEKSIMMWRRMRVHFGLEFSSLSIDFRRYFSTLRVAALAQGPRRNRLAGNSRSAPEQAVVRDPNRKSSSRR